MKALVVVLLLFISSAVFATGGFDCYNKSKTFEISAVNAMVFGSPIVGPVYVTENGVTIQIDKKYVLGYWNMGKELKVAITDSDYIEQAYLLKAKKSPFSNYFVGKVVLPTGDKIKVKCEVY